MSDEPSLFDAAIGLARKRQELTAAKQRIAELEALLSELTFDDNGIPQSWPGKKRVEEALQ